MYRFPLISKNLSSPTFQFPSNFPAISQQFSSSLTMGSVINTATLNHDVRYGQRLLPQVVDNVARDTPDRLVGMISKSTDISQSFDKVTVSGFSHAINFAAHWIDGHLGRGLSKQTYAYAGVADFRCMIMELAAIKYGHQALIFSPCNAISHNSTLFNSANCHTLFCAVEMEPLGKVLADKFPGLNIIQVPSYEEMIKSPVEHYPYLKTWEEAKDNKFLILHTSGSTAAPKALSFTNGFFATLDS